MPSLTEGETGEEGMKDDYKTRALIMGQLMAHEAELESQIESLKKSIEQAIQALSVPAGFYDSKDLLAKNMEAAKILLEALELVREEK